MSRRWMLAGLAGLAACSENPASGRRQLAFVPDEALAEMGDQAWSQLLAQAPVSSDGLLNARLSRVAQPLAAATGRTDLDWEFVVIEAPDLNAFVLPNGKVACFRGMMDFARADDELAAVMGHEAAHIVARHAAERVSQQLAVQAGVSLAGAVFGGENGENSEAIATALGLGAAYGVLLPYSRRHELEADRLGLGLMREAGFDPAAAVRFWERMIAEQGRRPQPLEALSSHPADARRLEALREGVRT